MSSFILDFFYSLSILQIRLQTHHLRDPITLLRFHCCCSLLFKKHQLISNEHGNVTKVAISNINMCTSFFLQQSTSGQFTFKNGSGVQMHSIHRSSVKQDASLVKTARGITGYTREGVTLIHSFIRKAHCKLPITSQNTETTHPELRLLNTRQYDTYISTIG